MSRSPPAARRGRPGGPGRDRGRHLDLGQAPLQSLGQRHRQRRGRVRRGAARRVAAGPGGDVARVRGDGEQAAPGLGVDQVRLPAAAAHHPAAYEAHSAALASLPGRRPGVVVDPDPGLDAAHPVDEQQRGRAGRPGPGRPPATGGRQLHGHVHPGGGFAEVLLEFQAGAVRRVPAVDAEPHRRPDPAGDGLAAGATWMSPLMPRLPGASPRG